MKTVKHADFLATMAGQGVPRSHYAFICPCCGTVQSAVSLIRAGAGATFDDVEKELGFSCVGRHTNAGPYKKDGAQDVGCDWTLGGFFTLKGGYEVETEDGKLHPHFEPASPEQAQELMKKNRVLGIVEGRMVFPGDELYVDIRETCETKWGKPKKAVNSANHGQGMNLIIFDDDDYRRSDRLVWHPIINVTIPPEIMAIARNVAGQDNRYTDQPQFIVQQKKITIGIDPEYIDGSNITVCYINGDSQEITDLEEVERLEKIYEAGDDLPDGYTRTSKSESWEFVTACFTEAGCQDYINANGHNLKPTRIYADGSYRNTEFQTLRNFILSLMEQKA